MITRALLGFIPPLNTHDHVASQKCSALALHNSSHATNLGLQPQCLPRLSGAHPPSGTALSPWASGLHSRFRSMIERKAPPPWAAGLGNRGMGGMGSDQTGSTACMRTTLGCRPGQQEHWCKLMVSIAGHSTPNLPHSVGRIQAIGYTVCSPMITNRAEPSCAQLDDEKLLSQSPERGPLLHIASTRTCC